jgi:hypothetical protein
MVPPVTLFQIHPRQENGSGRGRIVERFPPARLCVARRAAMAFRGRSAAFPANSWDAFNITVLYFFKNHKKFV